MFLRTAHSFINLTIYFNGSLLKVFSGLFLCHILLLCSIIFKISFTLNNTQFQTELTFMKNRNMSAYVVNVKFQRQLVRKFNQPLNNQ